MIEKIKLKDGAYYIGTCRNTNIAKWHNGKFIFIGLNFGNPYIETIPYYGDVKNESSDGFIPIEKIYVNVNNIIDEKNLQDYKNNYRNIYKNTSIDDMFGEIWKEVPDYEGFYFVSNLGRIKIQKSNKIMRQCFCRGYLIVGLSDYNRVRKTQRVHRLVLKAFKPNNNPLLESNHINGVRTDNRDINLEWIEHYNNSIHAFTSGNICIKLTPENVLEIKKMIRDGVMQKDIAKHFKVGTSIISEINTGKKWKNVII